ncbi:MAG TPA: aliphatic sulfonate ABC transporter substrate-binding protein [Rhodopila sp.]|uniref:aliphatic sulfonate ABC transporter substrate-binding protein n=1 Tax=Rhodopila sp. TaxID=2480087 RepID=UPI002BE70D24|nr:aliphatic sulfonate ABC transporter substrate-binding protein [Rhodopila sp.]HVY15006.1 aliphatic sulfonate ABC transporter substrate-binding protein [Rhodopila sp.]
MTAIRPDRIAVRAWGGAPRPRLHRRTLLASALALSAVRRAQAAGVLRMGFQKGEPILIALKAAKTLETQLAPLGIDVTWTEFQFGPPMLEAMRAGSIDVGGVGDTPPIFSQAAHGNLVYIAGQTAGGQAVLLPAGSTIQTLAELKGKRIAFGRGSSAHSLLLKVLEKAGLTYDQIQPVYLGPADAGAAFEHGAIDAWSIWDPYYALFETRPGVRTLITDAQVGGQNAFFLARAGFAHDNPSVTAKVVDAFIATGAWARAHRSEVADQLAASTGISREAIGRAVDRAPFQVRFMDQAFVDSQQKVADRFRALNLIPADIQVASAVWHPTA